LRLPYFLGAELAPNESWRNPVARERPANASILEDWARMVPHPGIDTAEIKDKARKDLLDLLHGVCKAISIPSSLYLRAEDCRFVGRKIW